MSDLPGRIQVTGAVCKVSVSAHDTQTLPSYLHVQSQLANHRRGHEGREICGPIRPCCKGGGKVIAEWTLPENAGTPQNPSMLRLTLQVVNRHTAHVLVAISREPVPRSTQRFVHS